MVYFAKVFIHKNCITNFKKHKNIIILYNILAKLSKIEDIFVVSIYSSIQHLCV